MSSSPYSPAAKILNELLGGGKGKSLKSVVYTPKGEMKCTKTTYAQCSNVLRNKRLLDRLYAAFLQRQEGGSKDKNGDVVVKNVGLLYVLLYELLLGPNQKIRGGGKLKRELVQCEDYLRSQIHETEKNAAALMVSNQQNKKIQNGSSGSSSTIPRYVRINTIKVEDREKLIEDIVKAADADAYDHGAAVGSKAPKKERLKTKITEKVYMDRHVPDLLVMEPTAETRGVLQPWVARQEVVLQDKSSCFSALCLVHGFDDDEGEDERGDGSSNSKGQVLYLDACAAPGNKTSHLAALLEQKYQDPSPSLQSKATKRSSSSFVVHAFDKSEDRFKLLKRRMADMVGLEDTNRKSHDRNSSVAIQCHNVDFLRTSGSKKDINNAVESERPKKRQKKGKVNASDDDGGDNIRNLTENEFCNVRGILLDPSCSGSGMTKTRDQNFSYAVSDGEDVPDGVDEDSINNKPPDDPFYSNDRVKSLSNFQYQALLHAVTAYPSCTRVVYSTCSIYVEENERVVERVLQSLSQRRTESENDGEETLAWQIVAPKCLQHWKRRGLVPERNSNSSAEKSEGMTSNNVLTQKEVDSMIRVDPSKDSTNGFFVACLQRRPSHQSIYRDDSRPLGETKGLLHLPVGMNYYTNQFNTNGVEIVDAHEKKIETTESPKNTQIPMAHEEKVDNKNKNAKKIAKKKAKKLEWKKQQRLKKIERLKKRGGQSNKTSSDS